MSPFAVGRRFTTGWSLPCNLCFSDEAPEPLRFAPHVLGELAAPDVPWDQDSAQLLPPPVESAVGKRSQHGRLRARAGSIPPCLDPIEAQVVHALAQH